MKEKCESLQVVYEKEVLERNFKVYGTPDNPLFLAKDVAEWIDYSWTNAKKTARKTGQMLETIDEDEKIKMSVNLPSYNVAPQVQTHGGLRENTEMWFLTEDGLYEVLMQSRKPIAKAFKKEVKRILKEIRLTGRYIPMDQKDLDVDISSKLQTILQNVLDIKNGNVQEIALADEYQIEAIINSLENRIAKLTCGIKKHGDFENSIKDSFWLRVCSEYGYDFNSVHSNILVYQKDVPSIITLAYNFALNDKLRIRLLHLLECTFEIQKSFINEQCSNIEHLEIEQENIIVMPPFRFDR